MRRFLLLTVLFVAATVIACDEDPVAPIPTTGSISLEIVIGTQEAQSPALQTVAATDASEAAQVSAEPRTGAKVKLSDTSTERVPVAEARVAGTGQVLNQATGTDQPVSAPSAPSASAAIDAGPRLWRVGPLRANQRDRGRRREPDGHNQLHIVQTCLERPRHFEHQRDISCLRLGRAGRRQLHLRDRHVCGFFGAGQCNV